MSIRTVLAVALALAALCWWLRAGPTQAPTSIAVGASSTAATHDSKVAISIVDAVHKPGAASDRSVRQDATPAARAERPCSVRLVGLDPNVPWTAPLQWRFRSGNRLGKELRAVDAQGASSFVPPAGAGHLESLHFRANDPAYRLADGKQRATLARGETRDIVVQPIGLLQGFAHDPFGYGTRARVQAFRRQPNGQLGALVAATQAKPNGSFRLRVPAAVDVRVVADSAQYQARVGHGQMGGLLLELEEESEVSDDDTFSSGADMWPTGSLLPASTPARCAHGQSQELPCLQLRAGSELTGRLATADGRPIAKVLVFAYPANRAEPGSWKALHWLHGSGLVRGGCARTNAEGYFALALAPGVPFVIATTDEAAQLRIGGPQVTAMAPGFVELFVP